jgi:hypothetical protein
MQSLSTAAARRVVPIQGGSPAGTALVAPHRVALIGPGEPTACAVVLGVLRRRSTPAEVADDIARLIGSPIGMRLPDVALVAGEPGDHRLVVSGELTISTPPSDAVDARSWSPRRGDVLRARLVDGSRFVVGAGDARDVDPFTNAFVDLRDGVVPATGLVVTWATSQSVGPTRDAPWPPPVVVQTAPIDRPPAPADAVVCRRGHVNDAARTYCAQCGIVLAPGADRFWAPLPPRVLRVPSPAIGVIVFDSGQRIEVGTDVVIGRTARDDSLVVSGAARAVVPAGDVSGISRSHASLRVVGWEVDLVDHGSLNGTFRWDRESSSWRRLGSRRPERLAHGDTIAFGRRTATYLPGEPTPDPRLDLA